MNWSMIDQEKCAEASFNISWLLLNIFSTIGQRMHAWGRINTLFENKTDTLDTIRPIPLSASLNTRNMKILAEEN